MPRQYYDYYEETPEGEAFGEFAKGFSSSISSGIERALARKEKNKDIELELATKGYRPAKPDDTVDEDTPKIEIFGKTYIRDLSPEERINLEYRRGLIKSMGAGRMYRDPETGMVIPLTTPEGEPVGAKTPVYFPSAKRQPAAVKPLAAPKEKDAKYWQALINSELKNYYDSTSDYSRQNMPEELKAKLDYYEKKKDEVSGFVPPLIPEKLAIPQKKGFFNSLIGRGKEIFGRRKTDNQIKLPPEIQTTSQAMQYLTSQGLSESEAAQWLRDNQ